jgi:hypothetical protein
MLFVLSYPCNVNRLYPPRLLFGHPWSIRCHLPPAVPHFYISFFTLVWFCLNKFRTVLGTSNICVWNSSINLLFIFPTFYCHKIHSISVDATVHYSSNVIGHLKITPLWIKDVYILNHNILAFNKNHQNSALNY